MEIIMLPFYIVRAAWRFLASVWWWLKVTAAWGVIFAAIPAVFMGISHVAESYAPAAIIYSIIAVGAFIRYRMDQGKRVLPE